MKSPLLPLALAGALVAPAALAASFHAPPPQRAHFVHVVRRATGQVFFAPTTELGGFRVVRQRPGGNLLQVRFNHDRRFDRRFDDGRSDGWLGGGGGSGAFPQSQASSGGAAAEAMQSDEIDPMAW